MIKSTIRSSWWSRGSTLVAVSSSVLVVVASLIFLSKCRPTSAKAAGNQVTKYKWRQSHLGGGGYIVGMLQDPLDPEVLYARCDVAGVFKSKDRGKSWQAINRGMTKCHHHSVESFALSPHDSQILFRCSGEARGNHIFGDIHKSIDGGENWYPVLDRLDYAGNGANRMLGEMIAVDPFRAEEVIAGGFSKGVYRSADLGESWHYIGLKGEPIGFVAFHPYQKDKLYVGTLNAIRYADYLYPDESYDRPKVSRLFLSEDGGDSWRLLHETDKFEFGDIAFSSEDPDYLLVAGLKGGIHWSLDAGQSFVSPSDPLPTDASYDVVVADPHRSGVFYTAPSRRGEHKHIPLVPLFVTTDYGHTWAHLHPYEEEDFIDYPPYIKNREFVGWAISDILVDVADSNRLFMSNWFGVSTSVDGGGTWSGNQFQGTETICAESIVNIPLEERKLLFTMADHQPAITVDNGISYEQFVKRIPGEPYHSSSTAIVASRQQPGLMIYGLTSRGSIISGIRRSEDYGKTATMVYEFPKGLFVQALREDPHHEGWFYAYVDGDLRGGAGLYLSKDWGITWDLVPSHWPQGLQSLPQQKNWIESELLSIVFYQVKNVCGTNQLLEIDPFEPNTIYFGEWTEGLFKSEDGGRTWRDIGQHLPFQMDRASTLNVITADNSKRGVFYAGFIREGLWKTEDSGDSWKKVWPLDGAVFNATSVVVGGVTGSELFMASEPLFWSQSPSQILYSPDSGGSWEPVYDGELGALRWKGIAVEPSTGRLHGVTAGNGVFYADRQEENAR